MLSCRTAERPGRPLAARNQRVPVAVAVLHIVRSCFCAGLLFLGLSRPLSCGELRFRGAIRVSTAQAVAGQGTPFEFGEVEPRAMLRRYAQREFARNPSGLGCREGVVERAELVGIEVVEHPGNPLGRREVDSDPGILLGNLRKFPYMLTLRLVQFSESRSACQFMWVDGRSGHISEPGGGDADSQQACKY